MTKELTVGELKKALIGVSDNTIVEICSDTGVDQGEGKVIVMSANGKFNSFSIYVNDVECDWEEEE